MSQLSPTDIHKMIQDKSKRTLGLNGNGQKVVPINEVKQYISDGWEYIKDLSAAKATIKLPIG